MFFISDRVKLAKNQAKAKQHLEASLLLFESYSLSSSTLSYKNNRRYSKKFRVNRCVYFNEVECVPLTVFYNLYFPSVSLKFRAYYITGKCGEFTVKNATLYLYIIPWHFFCFHKKISAFIIFVSFFDKVSHVRNRILTNGLQD